jgi:hypothetical protein
MFGTMQKEAPVNQQTKNRVRDAIFIAELILIAYGCSMLIAAVPSVILTLLLRTVGGKTFWGAFAAIEIVLSAIIMILIVFPSKTIDKQE